MKKSDLTMKSIENHYFKVTIAVAIVVILFIISTTYSLAVWKANTESHLDLIDHNQIDYDSDIRYLKEKSAKNDIQLATISTKLATIETLLIEIKKDLKDHGG